MLPERYERDYITMDIETKYKPYLGLIWVLSEEKMCVFFILTYILSRL